MAKAIGLDIGSHSVKLVELDGTAKKFKISRYVSREIPHWSASDQQGLTDAVAAVMAP